MGGGRKEGPGGEGFEGKKGGIEADLCRNPDARAWG